MTILINQIHPTSLGMLGIAVTIVTLVGGIIKLYVDNRNNIRNQTRLEENLKNEIKNNQQDIERLEADVVKLEDKIERKHESLGHKIDTLSEKIEKKMDAFQSQIIKALTKK